MTLVNENGIEKENKTIRKIKDYIIKNKIKTIVLVFLTIYFSGIIAQLINSLKLKTFKEFSLGLPCLYQWCTSITGIISLALMLIIDFVLYLYLVKPRTEKSKGTEDYRNFNYAEEGTYGTSGSMSDDEIEKILEWKPIDETHGIILGIKDGKVLSLPTDEEFEAKAKRNNWDIKEQTNNRLNRHKAVIGASGTMKSRAVARNEIIQSVVRGESLIATDPKGELYEDTASFCEEHGYDVKVFNLVNLENSDSWGALREIEGNDIYAKIFAYTVITNADEHGEAYWNDNSQNIFKAVSLLVENSDYPEENKNLGTVYDLISQKTPEELQNLFSMERSNSVANRAFTMFNKSSDQVKGQIINGLGIMLDVFQSDTIRNITSNREIDLCKPGFEKCAYFLITSDQHTTFDFLAVLFYSMLFIKLVEAIDNARAKKEKTIPVNLVLDEFANIGQIPDFKKKISTIRSRDLNVTVIFQNIAQLQNRYPNNEWAEILGNCDTTIFLGCTDQLTAEYISAKCGIASIQVESENYGYDQQRYMLNQSTEMRKVKSIGQRKVYNPDEILRIKNTNCLIFLRGQKPLLAEKFDYTLHPLSKEFEEISKVEHIPEWRKKKIEEKAAIEREQRELEEKREKERQEELKRREEKLKAIEAEKEAKLEAKKKAETDYINNLSDTAKEFMKPMDKSFNKGERNEIEAKETTKDNIANNISIDTDTGEIISVTEKDNSSVSEPTLVKQQENKPKNVVKKESKLKEANDYEKLLNNIGKEPSVQKPKPEIKKQPQQKSNKTAMERMSKFAHMYNISDDDEDDE